MSSRWKVVKAILFCTVGLGATGIPAGADATPVTFKVSLTVEHTTCPEGTNPPFLFPPSPNCFECFNPLPQVGHTYDGFFSVSNFGPTVP